MSLKNITPQTENALRSLVAAALEESFMANEKAREVCLLLASLMENSNADGSGDSSDAEVHEVVDFASIINSDPALVEPGDSRKHPNALTELREARFCQRYDARIFVNDQRQDHLYPTVCMKCGQHPYGQAGEQLIESTVPCYDMKDSAGWTHLDCAFHWVDEAKAGEEARALKEKMARVFDDE